MSNTDYYQTAFWITGGVNLLVLLVFLLERSYLMSRIKALKSGQEQWKAAADRNANQATVEKSTADKLKKEIAREELEHSQTLETLKRVRLEKQEAKTKLDIEKERREYYQDLVYKTCDTLDQISGRDSIVNGIACGTVEMPSTQLQEALESLKEEVKRLRNEDGRTICVTPPGCPEYPRFSICPACNAEAIQENKEGPWLCLNPECKTEVFHKEFANDIRQDRP